MQSTLGLLLRLLPTLSALAAALRASESLMAPELDAGCKRPVPPEAPPTARAP